MTRFLFALATLLAITYAYDSAIPAGPPPFLGGYEVAVDNGYSERKGKEKKYTCKTHHLRVTEGCRNGEGKTDDDLPCFTPEVSRIKHYKKHDGNHAVVTCSKSLHDGEYARFMNGDGDIISFGQDETTKVIKCSKYGDWIAQNAEGTWVILKNVFCM